jgi:carbon storage regulator
MLVLSRREGESIFIGKDIEVKVLSVQGNRIRIGIAAPRNVVVIREELKTCDSTSTTPSEN